MPVQSGPSESGPDGCPKSRLTACLSNCPIAVAAVGVQLRGGCPIGPIDAVARPLVPLPALLQRSHLWRRIRVSHGSCLDDEVFIRPAYRCAAAPSVLGAKMSQPLMTPTAATAEQSNLADFMQRHGFNDYDALHAWSVDHSEEFWPALWDFCNVISTAEATQVLADGDDFLRSRWFRGAELNFAENLLRWNDDRVAIVGILEGGERRTLTYAELYRAVARVAAEFSERGLGPGDRVAGWLPNVPETVICTLAAASIGAVWTSCSPDFGVEGALDRFGQTRPKLLIACDAYQYGGKRFDVSAKAEEVRRRIDSVEALFWTHDIERMVAERREDSIAFQPCGFDDPLYVLYSSGTTGRPKCIVHGVGGTLLQHLKEHRLHTDLRRSDTLFYFTTCGWMMWNWLVSGLASGCAIVLYDGSPFHPRRSELIDLIDAEGITIFGVSAKYLSALQKFGVKPRTSHRLSELRSILSTGSPLAPESFDYVYRDFKEDVALASISGGTDIVSCFALGNPLLPIYAGELQCKGLGMAVDVFGRRRQTAASRTKGRARL